MVDAKTQKMTVRRDGKVIKTIPVTTGKPGYDTWNGQMVITERLSVTRMNGETVGYGGEYDIKDVPHAMRLTTSGTFIHGNYWGGGAFGNYATPATAASACATSRAATTAAPRRPGSSTTRSSATWSVVKHSHDKTVAPDNGLNGWNMSWKEWTA